MKPIFTFSGPIGSGKSTVSKEFAERVGAKWNSFGSTVRRVALSQGTEPTRENLQKLGESLVKNEGQEFCRQVLAGAEAEAEDMVVIDGVRHADVLETLRRIVGPRRLVAIFVDAPFELREKRVKARDGLSRDAILRLQTHSTEIQVEASLKEKADLILLNDNNRDESQRKLIEWAKERGLLP